MRSGMIIQRGQTVQFFKEKMKEFWSDESGQGIMEYIMLVVLVIGAAMVLRSKAKDWLGTTSGKVDSGLGGFDGNLNQ